MKSVLGIGINDAEYQISRYEYIDGKRCQVWICPYYLLWKSVLTRSLCIKFKKKWPKYTDVCVCEEWLTFSNFKSWMEKQDWEGKELDKDILYTGNKEYSPSKCCFVSKRVNTFIIDGAKVRGNFPIGVSWNKSVKKFVAQCQNGTGKQLSRYFDNVEDAFYWWLETKTNIAISLMENEQDKRISSAIISRYKNYPIPDFSNFPTIQDMLAKSD